MSCHEFNKYIVLLMKYLQVKQYFQIPKRWLNPKERRRDRLLYTQHVVINDVAQGTPISAQDPVYINEIGLSTTTNAPQYESLALGNRDERASYEPLNLESWI